jgi:hypothetical protein
MNHIRLLLLVFCSFFFLGVNSLFADRIEEAIVLSLETKHHEFLDGEQLSVGLRITNRGNTPFIVDTYGKFKENSVKIYIRNYVGQLLFPKQEFEELKKIMIMPGAQQDFIVNLDDVFGQIPQGKYSVHAILINGDAKTSSNIVNLEIVKGIELLRLKNLREGLISNEFLLYTLMYWVRDGGEQLFLRIDNLRTGQLYDFISLGNLVRVAKPSIRFLPQNVVEVLHQNSSSPQDLPHLRHPECTLSAAFFDRFQDNKPRHHGLFERFSSSPLQRRSCRGNPKLVRPASKLDFSQLLTHL